MSSIATVFMGAKAASAPSEDSSQTTSTHKDGEGFGVFMDRFLGDVEGQSGTESEPDGSSPETDTNAGENAEISVVTVEAASVAMAVSLVSSAAAIPPEPLVPLDEQALANGETLLSSEEGAGQGNALVSEQTTTTATPGEHAAELLSPATTTATASAETPEISSDSKVKASEPAMVEAAQKENASPAPATPVNGRIPVISSETLGEAKPENVVITFSKPNSRPERTKGTAVHGISGAQEDTAMKKGEKMHKVAGSAQQELPGEGALTAVLPSNGESLPPKQDQSARNPMRAERLESAAATVTPLRNDVVEVEACAPGTSPLLDPRVRALERTHDMVALHALRLRDSSNDSLRVVIKPGAGLQLSLELHQRDTGIEVQAILQSGDADHLNRHWNDLQQRLESKGVRLSNLTSSDGFNNGSNSSFQQRHRSSPDSDQVAAGAFAEFAFAGAMTESVNRRAPRSRSHKGWESWA